MSTVCISFILHKIVCICVCVCVCLRRSQVEMVYHAKTIKKAATSFLHYDNIVFLGNDDDEHGNDGVFAGLKNDDIHT